MKGAALCRSLHPIIFIYLYTVGLLNPHTLASSDTFIFPS